MTDAFDALREADANRVEWAKAARAFDLAVRRVYDKGTVANLERAFQKLLDTPLAPAAEAWALVEEAAGEVWLESPLTHAQATDAGLTTEEWYRELSRCGQRDQEIVGRFLSAEIPEAPGVEV